MRPAKISLGSFIKGVSSKNNKRSFNNITGSVFLEGGKIMYQKIFGIFSAVLVLTGAFPAVSPVSAQPSLQFQGNIEASPNGVYIVQMLDDPVAIYKGGIKAMKATARQNG